MIVIVTGDRSLLVEHIAGIGIPVLAELVGYHVAFIDAIIDESGLPGHVGFIGRRDWLDHRWRPMSLGGPLDVHTVIVGCGCCARSGSAS